MACSLFVQTCWILGVLFIAVLFIVFLLSFSTFPSCGKTAVAGLKSQEWYAHCLKHQVTESLCNLESGHGLFTSSCAAILAKQLRKQNNRARSSDFGCPQKRPRVYILMARQDCCDESNLAQTSDADKSVLSPDVSLGHDGSPGHAGAHGYNSIPELAQAGWHDGRDQRVGVHGFAPLGLERGLKFWEVLARAWYVFAVSSSTSQPGLK